MLRLVCAEVLEEATELHSRVDQGAAEQAARQQAQATGQQVLADAERRLAGAHAAVDELNGRLAALELRAHA